MMLGIKDSTRELKQQWREYIKHLFTLIDQQACKQWSEAIGKRLIELDIFKNALRVMFYASIDREVETWGMIEEALESGKTVSLPRMGNKGMLQAFVVTKPSNQLTEDTNDYGISEPDPNICALQPMDTIDVVIVPGLAFDKSGRRLGRGKGYYDRFLSQLPARTVRIGLGFGCQVFPLLPFDDPHDETLHILLSEDECLFFDSIRKP